jgi:RecB family exonuclease
MAVVVRSASDLGGVRRALDRQGVPVEQRRDEVALWQQPSVRALLDLLAVVCGDDAAVADTVVDLMLGPLGRLDPAALLALRRDVLSSGQVGSGEVDALLASAVLDGRSLPGGAGHPAVRSLATTVEAGRAALAAGGSLEDVLWALWDAVGVAGRWRRAALAGGRDGAAADRDLDAVVALFDAAAAFVDRLPGAGPLVFLDHVRNTRLPSDGWGTSSGVAQAVAVVTAHATKGAEWDTVVLVRVQEERWPDVRRRDSLFGVDDLVAVTENGRVPSPAEQATTLLAAERRLFHLAVSRARSSLLVTAVEDDELRPSRFVDELLLANHATVLEPDSPAAEPPSTSTVLPDPVLDLTSIVAELRARVCIPDAPADERDEAARQLARLAQAGVPGADPGSWYGLVPLTDDAPLVDPGDVRLSPSQVESYLRCPLRWMLQRSGGDDGAVLRRAIGSLVHQLAFEATTDHLDDAAVWQRFEQLWGTVDAGRGWVARRERARATDMVRRLLGWLAEHADTAVATETDVSAQAGGALVQGRLDRVDRAEDGSLVVIDFKTGTSTPTNADAASNPQLGVYQWAVAQGALRGAEPARAGGGMLVHLGVAGERARTQHQPALRDSGDPEWPRRLVDQVADGATQAAFAAFVNSGCGGCPVRTSCPAQPAGGQVAP